MNRAENQSGSADKPLQTDSIIEVNDQSDSFSAALAMIAALPLTDAEKAEAVRRLLATREGGTKS